MMHIESTHFVVRWYDEADGFRLRKPYRAICSIFLLEEDHVFVYGMHGSLSKMDMKALFEALLDRGVKKVTAERKGKLITKDIEALMSKA